MAEEAETPVTPVIPVIPRNGVVPVMLQADEEQINPIHFKNEYIRTVVAIRTTPDAQIVTIYTRPVYDPRIRRLKDANGTVSFRMIQDWIKVVVTDGVPSEPTVESQYANDIVYQSLQG